MNQAICQQSQGKSRLAFTSGCFAQSGELLQLRRGEPMIHYAFIRFANPANRSSCMEHPVLILPGNTFPWGCQNMWRSFLAWNWFKDRGVDPCHSNKGQLVSICTPTQCVISKTVT